MVIKRLPRRGWVFLPFVAAVALVAAGSRVTSAAAPGQRILAEEQSVVDLVNIERKKVGRKPYIVNYSLQDAAWSHNEVMVAKDCLSHTGCGDGDPRSRVDKTGYEAITVGENIAQGQRTPEEVVNGEVCTAEQHSHCIGDKCTNGRCNGWMQSPPHKANILKSDWTDIGVAFSPSGKLGPTWTQVFAAPQPDYATVTPPRAPTPTPTPKPCVMPPEDVNADKVVDQADVDAVSAHFMARPSTPGWDARFDVVPNGVVDLYDIFGVVKAMGAACP